MAQLNESSSVAEVYESPLISNARLKETFAAMVKCRMLEEAAFAAFHYPGAGIGHEATLVSAAIQLEARDSIASAPIEFVYALTQNKPARQILQAMRSAASGGEKVFAKKLARAVESAKLNRKKKSSPIALAYAGNTTSESEPWHEAMRSAVKLALPMVFVFDDAAWTEKPSRVPQYGFPILTVDGSDALAVYRVVQEAAHRARYRGGPTLIECRSYRNPSGATTNNAAGGATTISFLEALDPIQKLQHQLEAKKLYDAAWAAEIETKFGEELKSALVEFSSASSHIGPASEHPSQDAIYAGQK